MKTKKERKTSFKDRQFGKSGDYEPVLFFLHCFPRAQGICLFGRNKNPVPPSLPKVDMERIEGGGFISPLSLLSFF